jgi:hypothetical protein
MAMLAGRYEWTKERFGLLLALAERFMNHDNFLSKTASVHWLGYGYDGVDEYSSQRKPYWLPARTLCIQLTVLPQTRILNGSLTTTQLLTSVLTVRIHELHSYQAASSYSILDNTGQMGMDHNPA